MSDFKIIFCKKIFESSFYRQSCFNRFRVKTFCETRLKNYKMFFLKCFFSNLFYFCFQVKVIERALLLQTNVELNERLLRQLTAGNLERRF